MRSVFYFIMILPIAVPLAWAVELSFKATGFPESKVHPLKEAHEKAYKKASNCLHLKKSRPKLRAALLKSFEEEVIPYSYEKSELYCGARKVLPFRIMLTNLAFEKSGECFDLPSVILHEMIHYSWDGWIFSNITEDEIEDVLTYCLSS